MGSRAARRAARTRVTWEIPVAIGGHLLMGGILASAESCSLDAGPLIDPDEVIVATAVAALPKQTSRMPDKAMRRPDPPKGTTPKTEAPPPPPKTSDMVLKTPEAEPTRGEPEPDDRDRAKELEQLLAEQRREQLLRDLSADIGPRDQSATSPDGVESAEVAGSGAAIGDPELARYVEQLRQAVLPNWAPLPSTIQNRPDLQVTASVKVSASGVLSEPQIVKGSGDASFDRTATIALIKTARVPAPPEKWRASAARGVQFRLYAKDKQ